jgi:hypothetical protein
VGGRDEIDAIEVASPCTVPWSGMAGDERVRFCGECRKHVYNLAEMAADEARALITKREGKSVCLRVTRRADGTVVTGGCRARLRAAWTRGPMAFAGALVVVFALEMWAQAFGLRALAEFLRREPARPTATADEIERAPIVHTSRPVRSERLKALKHVSMGGVPLAPAAQLDDANQPKKVPPSLAMALKTSGDAPHLPRGVYYAWISVSASGSVSDVFIDDAEPVRSLVGSALKAWTFRPLTEGGTPVPFRSVVAFRVE